LSFDGEVKLCDFGIASAIQLDLVPTETVEGKAGYMSPEHARGESLDERADLFAAGIILWELLAGRRMYKASEGATLIEVARRGEVPALKKLNLPDEERLRAIVSRALAVEPSDRYPSAAAMFDELYGYCLATKQMASALRFGEWLSSHFAAEKVARRRARERALVALELGPPLIMEPIPSSRGVPMPPDERLSQAGPPSPVTLEDRADAAADAADANATRTPTSVESASIASGHGTGKLLLVAVVTALALLALLGLTGNLRW
jgi:serine/threonine-protein kinase